MAATRHAHHQRAQVDAVAIGSRTLLVDDPLLTPRHVYRERPLARVIFDRSLRALPTARILSTLPAGPVIIVTTPEAKRLHGDRASALEAAGATVDVVDERSLAGALRVLARRGIQSMVLEGGASLHQAAWDEDLVDYVQVYVAPIAVGAQGPAMAPGPAAAMTSLLEQQVRMLGPDVLIEGYVHRPD